MQRLTVKDPSLCMLIHCEMLLNMDKTVICGQNRVEQSNDRRGAKNGDTINLIKKEIIYFRYLVLICRHVLKL